MKFLAVLTQAPDIYQSLSTRNKVWEDKFILVKVTNCGRHSVRKHREINNNEQ